MTLIFCIHVPVPLRTHIKNVIHGGFFTFENECSKNVFNVPHVKKLMFNLIDLLTYEIIILYITNHQLINLQFIL